MCEKFIKQEVLKEIFDLYADITKVCNLRDIGAAQFAYTIFSRNNFVFSSVPEGYFNAITEYDPIIWFYCIIIKFIPFLNLQNMSSLLIKNWLFSLGAVYLSQTYLTRA
jgi:ssDNA-specific exonuclease RecJ